MIFIVEFHETIRYLVLNKYLVSKNFVYISYFKLYINLSPPYFYFVYYRTKKPFF